MLGRIDQIADIDITNGDKTIDYLSQEFYLELRKQFNVKRTTAQDGHSTIFLGNFKMDFSSNFNVPGIDKLLLQKGIKQPTSMQREMFSRDFTCNALLLAFDLKTLTDPTHQGFADIKAKMIKTCLAPEITLTSNKNRVIRAVYLAAKLDFDVDPKIIAYVKAHPDTVKISTHKVTIEKLNEAFKRDADKASHLLTQMGLWNYIPIPESVYPYYQKALKGSVISTSTRENEMAILRDPKNPIKAQKLAYFQGGGGVNEPELKHTKYHPDPAIIVQPRFKEPFYRNYDLYDVPGIHDTPVHGPGSGWNSMSKFKSIQDYLAYHRKILKDKYKADDSYITEDNYQERVSKMKTRARQLNQLIKISQRNYDYGQGLYDQMDHFKSVKDFLDSNHLDFPIDDQVTPIIGNSESFETPIKLGPSANGNPNDGIVPGSVGLGDFESYPGSAQIGGYLDRYLGQNDPDDKPESTLDYGNDLTDGQEMSGTLTEPDLERLFAKYLTPAPSSGTFGLPDGVDLPDEDLGDPTNIQPFYGTQGPDSLMYEGKWNI